MIQAGIGPRQSFMNAINFCLTSNRPVSTQHFINGCRPTVHACDMQEHAICNAEGHISENGHHVTHVCNTRETVSLALHDVLSKVFRTRICGGHKCCKALQCKDEHHI